MSQLDTSRFRERLLEERAKATGRIDYLHRENPSTLEEDAGELTSGDNHMADVATETFDRELDSTLEESSTNVVAEIDAALQRIEDGTFGTCAVCGKPIEEERLEILPWTTLCIDDKRHEEGG
jgi:DnaK suppressor protein